MSLSHSYSPLAGVYAQLIHARITHILTLIHARITHITDTCHPEFQLGTFIRIWDIRNGLRLLPANKHEYPPSALQFNYTKEI